MRELVTSNTVDSTTSNLGSSSDSAKVPDLDKNNRKCVLRHFEGRRRVSIKFILVGYSVLGSDTLKTVI